MSGKANETEGKKKVKPEEIDSFEDEERVPEGESAYGQGKSKAAQAKEKESEKEDEEEGGEDKEDMKAKKSLTSKFSAVADKVVELRSAGVAGKDAEAALQPLLNELGVEIEKALHPTTGDAAVANALAAVAESQKMIAETLKSVVADVAVLKAGAQRPTTERIESPFIPKPRSLSVTKSKPTQPVKELSQIEKIARRSTGLPVE